MGLIILLNTIIRHKTTTCQTNTYILYIVFPALDQVEYSFVLLKYGMLVNSSEGKKIIQCHSST